MLKKINLLVERPGETRVRVVVQVSPDLGPVEGFEVDVATKGGAGGRGWSDHPVVLGTSDVAWRATPDAFEVDVATKGGGGGRGWSYRPATLDTPDVVSRATLDAFLDRVTRFEPADSLVTVQAFEHDALRLLVVLDVRDPIPDPIPVDLIHHG